jgi:hypothetical protein
VVIENKVTGWGNGVVVVENNPYEDINYPPCENIYCKSVDNKQSTVNQATYACQLLQALCKYFVVSLSMHLDFLM